MKEYKLVRPLLATVPDDAVQSALSAYDAALATRHDEAPARAAGARRSAELELQRERTSAILEARAPTLSVSHVHRATIEARDAERQLAAYDAAVAIRERELDQAVGRAGVPMLTTVLGAYVELGSPNPLPRHLEILWVAFAWPMIAERPGQLVVERNPHRIDPTRRFFSTTYRVDRPSDRRGWWPIPLPGTGRATGWSDQGTWWTHVIAEITRPKHNGFDVEGATIVLRNPEPAWHGGRRPRRPSDPGRPDRDDLVWVGGPDGYAPDQLFG